MTAWSDAFGKAIKATLITIGWAVVGFIVIVVGLYVGGSMDPYGDLNLIVIFASGLVGMVIMVFGGLAAIFKIVGDMIEESQVRPSPPASAHTPIPVTGGSKLCTNCGQSVSGQGKFCNHCGQNLE